MVDSSWSPRLLRIALIAGVLKCSATCCLLRWLSTDGYLDTVCLSASWLVIQRSLASSAHFG
eukprot:scaffold273_cov138-Skeletonema_menzelii.AAC.4